MAKYFLSARLRNGVLHLGDDVKKVADARLGQVDDVLGDET